MNEAYQRQAEIRAKCFHPTGQWEEFRTQDLEQSVVSRFEQIAVRYPDRLAVQFGNDKLTYAELNMQANQLARAILKQCGQDSSPILFLLDQGVAAMVVLLGILKAGKCYVALDPEFPIARLAAILAACQSTLLVTNQKHEVLAQQLMSYPPFGQLLMLNQSFDNFEKTNLGLVIAPESLAYITFTSGTTGLPKGVPQNHRYLLRITQVFTNACHICPQDRIALTYSNAFGIAGLQIFPALLNGASLWPFVLSDGVEALATWLAVAQITYWDTVPSVFRQLESQPNYRAGPDLRVLVMGGERITPADITLFQRHFLPSTLLHISYGLSEANGLALYWVDHATQITGARVPVGYPPRDTTLLLLDENGQPVADGAVGEIVVKSRYITAGYWQQPALNQGRFAPDPQGSDARLFYTGDLGMIQPDGCLIHLGRKDHQVKIRGVRVELAEIEQALWSLDFFREVLVMAKPDPYGNLQLIAYLVPQNTLPPTVSDLRQYLSKRLPIAMLPSAYHFLDALPLNANKKVDINALPGPNNTRPLQAVAYVAARNDVEAAIIDIWQEVLGIAPIGIHDHFLDLGGDSLQAHQIVGRMLNQLNTIISPHVLMLQPTIAKVALAMVQHQAKLIDSQMLELFLIEIENHE